MFARKRKYMPFQYSVCLNHNSNQTALTKSQCNKVYPMFFVGSQVIIAEEQSLFDDTNC